MSNSEEKTEEMEIDLREIVYILLEQVGGKVTIQRSILERMRSAKSAPKIKAGYVKEIDAITVVTQRRMLAEAQRGKILTGNRKLILPRGGN